MARMRKPFGVMVVIGAAGAGGAVIAASPASAQNFFFTKVADSALNDFFPDSFGAPSISDLGHVAFRAQTANQSLTRVVRSAPGAIGPLTPIVDDAGPLGPISDNVSVNNLGQVALWAGASGGGLNERIMRGSGGAGGVTTIAEAGTGRPFDFMSVIVSLNDSGVVAWQGEMRAAGFPQGLFTGSGVGTPPAFTTVFRTDDATDFTSSFAGPAINNNGQIAFRASTTSSGGDAIFRYDGGSNFTLIASSAGPLSAAFDDEPMINNSGRVAVVGRLDGPLLPQVLLVGDGSVAPTPIIDTTGVLEDIGSASINDLNQLAYIALFDDFQTQGIFTGADLTSDAVIKTGDTLDGSVVTSLRFYREGLNNSGQIAFFAQLADGRGVIMVATPVPAPGALSLGAAVGLWAARRRRSG